MIVITGPDVLSIENLVAPICFIPSEIKRSGRKVQKTAIVIIIMM